MRYIEKYTIWFPLLAAIILRIVHLGGRSLGGDEGLTACLASAPISDTIAGCMLNFQQPLYYVLLWPWVRILGLNEFSLGLFSVIAGVLIVYYVFKLAELIGGNRIAFLSAMIAALSPYMVFISNDCQPHALTGLFTIGAAYYFYRATNERDRNLWLLTSAFTAASIYTHPIGFALVIFQFLYIVLDSNARNFFIIRNYLLSLAAVIIVYLPQVFATSNRLKLQAEAGAASSAAGSFVAILERFSISLNRILTGCCFSADGAAGFNSLQGWGLLLNFITLVFTILTAVIIIYFLIKNRPKWGLFLLLLCLVPFVLIFRANADLMQFSLSSAALCILISLAVLSLNKTFRISFLAVYLVIAGFSLGKAYSLPVSIVKPENYRAISSIIKSSRFKLDNVIFYGNSGDNLNWQFYDPGGSIFGSPEYFRNNFHSYPLLPLEEIFSPEKFPVKIDSLSAGGGKIWMIVSDHHPQDVLPLVSSWDDRYPIEVVYTDRFLTLFKIGAQYANTEINSKPEE